METLIRIQKELKAPKNQFNKFGKYKYRSCEDILEAVKPLCASEGAMLIISDEVREIGGKLFVEAKVTFKHNEFETNVYALAMHPLEKKGMDASQITGAASSYARKYALNGLFLIDDTKDPDSTNTHGKDPDEGKEKPVQKPVAKEVNNDAWNKAMEKLSNAKNITEVKDIWEENADLHTDKEFIKIVTDTKNKFNIEK